MRFNQAFLLLEFIAAGFLVSWLVSGRSPRLRSALEMQYTRRYLPFVLRVFSASAPTCAPVIAAAGLLASSPPAIGQWLFLIVVDSFAGAVLLAHQRPLAAIPGWLRRKVEAGVIPQPVPGRWDNLYMWVILAIAAVSTGLALWAALARSLDL